MISTRKLIRIAKKWQRKAAIGRKRISFRGKSSSSENASTGTCRSTSSSSSCSSPVVAEKGHVVVYTVDQKRYSFPIAYLNYYIFIELLKIAEEAFGLPSDGPIMIPCEAVFMDYFISLIQRNATIDIEKALLASCQFMSSYNDNNLQFPRLYCF